MSLGNCATPNCDLCEEEAAAEALDDVLIGPPCGDVHDAGDGDVYCILIKGHDGSHTDGGDEWSGVATFVR